jgi:hypothetical protein
MRPWFWGVGLSVVGLTLAQAAPAADFAYVGSKKCRMCHIKQYKSWEQTNMAKAFELLKPGARAEQRTAAGLDPEKDYTTDAECLSCHTTGYGEPGGFESMEATPTLAGVGCEMCHGAGGEYIKKPYMTLSNKEYKLADLRAVGLISPPTAEYCTGVCHNTKSPFVGDDYVFDFEANKAKGTHEHIPLKYSHE